MPTPIAGNRPGVARSSATLPRAALDQSAKQGDDEQRQKREEHDLGDGGGPDGDAAEAEQDRDHDDEGEHCAEGEHGVC